jgi:hypothetical protein
MIPPSPACLCVFPSFCIYRGCLSPPYSQDWDFAQYLARMGRIDKRAENERDRRELEKAKEEAEKKVFNNLYVVANSY